MKKKYLCVLLVALLLLAAMPLLAMATDGTGVDSEEALRSALEQGGEIVLTDNITLDENSGGLVIAKGVEVTLDLAGYTLRVRASFCLLTAALRKQIAFPPLATFRAPCIFLAVLWRMQPPLATALTPMPLIIRQTERPVMPH